ncbi:MAG: GIY-YIG nuclease family protein [Alphaproteobacteria bacterium]|nr:GIY-YIG nuclease family protein [Alphaproteobacteria bacterium]
MQDNINNRTIFCRDNIDILQGINSDSIDLIYLDPPFNKNKTFTAPIGSSAEGAAFDDIFRAADVKEEWLEVIKKNQPKASIFLNSIKNISGKNSYNFCYLAYMAIRLMACYRILKQTGSIYLHCDSTMSHYLKLLMDCIFSEDNFRNEIIWQRNDKRGKGSQFKSRKFGSNTDTILFYTKSNDYILQATLWREENISKKFDKSDEKGRLYYTGIPIFRAKSMGARPNLCYQWRGFISPHPSGWRLSKERLEEEYQKGNIIISTDGKKIERRKYLDDYDGEPMDNNWTDIARISTSNEATGYPTQKPLALLERIIKASSNEGDMVLDPFCGCATTCVAAEKLNRQWVGIDVSHKAYELVQIRLQKEIGYLLGDVHYHTTPPKRTDINADEREKKYVYIISHQHYPNEYKVGIAKNITNRLNSYQTSDPNRAYKLEYSFLTPNFRDIEKYIHQKYNNKHEWVSGELAAIKADIDAYGVS